MANWSDLFGGSAGAPVGSILARPVTWEGTDPAKYLRGEQILSQTTYPDLFAAVGGNLPNVLNPAFVAVAAAAANQWLSVAYGNGVWIAVSLDGTNRVMRSTNDGTSWTAVAAAEANSWLSVAYANGVWIAVANSGTNRVMRSTNDGTSWTAVAAAEANLWQSVAYGNGVWIAVSTNGTNMVMRADLVSYNRNTQFFLPRPPSSDANYINLVKAEK
jgi:hypothetical protein